MDNHESGYGDRVRECREAVGWSQHLLAQEFGGHWRQTTVARIESGGQPLRLHEAMRLAGVFRMSLCDFTQSNLAPCDCVKVAAVLRDTLRRMEGVSG